MSTKKIAYSTTTTRHSIEETRRLEAEALSRRLGAATSAVATQQARYNHLVSGLDEARTRLPDLNFTAPSVPPPPAGNDVASIEAFANELNGWVANLERESSAAIQRAEVAQQRRQSLARTWHALHDTMAELQVRHGACRALSKELHLTHEIVEPALPHREASLEEAQDALAQINAQLALAQAQQASLELQRQTRLTAGALTGNAVSTTGASQRMEHWNRDQIEARRQEAERAIAKALADVKLRAEELPVALQLQLQQAIEQAPGFDHNLRITDLIARHRVRLDSIAHAQQLLATPPHFIDDELSQRWQNLACRLQVVACGHEDFSNTLTLEHQQIHDDAVRAVQRMYAKTVFIDAGVDAGFQIIEDDNLIVMDLEEFPEYWVELRQEACPDGYATFAELKADVTANPANDAAVVNHVCRKLQAMVSPANPRVESAIQEIDHGKVVPRTKRPRSRAKSLSASRNARH